MEGKEGAENETDENRSGDVHYGNFEANKTFLSQVGAPERGDRVLEIGCGNGGMLNYLTEKGFEVEGVEISKERIKKSKQIYGSLPIRKVDGIKLPFEKNEFDIVISFDVIEHIPDTDGHLTEVKRVLKKRGKYLLQSPNKWTNSVFETIRWKSFTAWREDHCSLHSYYEFKERFRKNGFSAKFHDVPVVNEYFKEKIYRHLGKIGVSAIKVIDIDRLPLQMKTNFYIEAANEGELN